MMQDSEFESDGVIARLEAENERLLTALRRVIEVVEGRDHMDGYPRSASERLRRLAAAADIACDAIGGL